MAFCPSNADGSLDIATASSVVYSAIVVGEPTTSQVDPPPIISFRGFHA